MNPSLGCRTGNSEGPVARGVEEKIPKEIFNEY